jgi:signal peptidase I
MTSQRKEPTIGSFDDGYAPPASRVEDSGDPLNSPRTPGLAFVLAFFFMVSGFQYAGRLMLGVVLLVGILVFFAVLGNSGLVQSVGGTWSMYGVVIVWYVAMLGLPPYFARRGARGYRLKWYNRWYWYVLINLLVTVPAYLLVLNKERFFGFTTYRTPSGSMLPTLGVGDYVTADTRAAVIDALRPGDVATFEREDEIWVKRIVAGPGQHVQIDAAGLKVDGKLQSRAHTLGQDLMEPNWMHYTDVTLGPDQFFLMGDNRGNSRDSRTEGPIERTRFRGKITTIFYSNDAARIGKVE